MTHRRRSTDLLDTGQLKAIEDAASDAAREAARDVIDERKPVTMSECRENAREVVTEFHDRFCPAKGLVDEVATMKTDIAGINVTVAKIDTRVSTAVKVLVAAVCAAFALACALTAAAWAVYQDTKAKERAMQAPVQVEDVRVAVYTSSTP
jgi:hypothetical protein